MRADAFLSYGFSIPSLTDHPFAAQDFDLPLPSLIYPDFHQRDFRRQHGNQRARCLVVPEQWSDQDKQRGLVFQCAARKISFSQEITRLSMPLDSNPVVESLEWQIRICGCFDFAYHQTAIRAHCQQIDSVSFFANKARYLWINVPNIYRRKQLAERADKIGLQPALLVSMRERVTAFGLPRFSDILHDLFDRFSKGVSYAFPG